jgi:DNA (cytosine-5)-methyltransferase 1
MTAYYNENDPSCAAILRELIASGVIAPGDVDYRSIKEVKPDDLKGYTQCHFFAGAGLWSVAARLAGWPDDRQLWTGSCPCQPFSQAGKGAGVDDPRHLWPDLYQLIRARRPTVWMGEQVAGKAGRDWFAGVRADLDAGGYASRAVDIPAGAVGAPHIRNRLYIVAERMADAESIGGGAGYCQIPAERNGAEPANYYAHDAVAATIVAECALGDAFDTRLERQRRDGDGAGGRSFSLGSTTATDGGDLADTAGSGRQQGEFTSEATRYGREPATANMPTNYWSDSEWITCHDGKARRTKPGLRLLVDGMAGRVDLWRSAGNSIVPQVAAEVIAAYLDTEDT